MTTELLNQGFTHSKKDYSLFISKHHHSITIIAIYIDDIIITGNNEEHFISIKQHVDNKFGIQDLGLQHYFLGIEINYLPDGIVLSQKKFTNELL